MDFFAGPGARRQVLVFFRGASQPGDRWWIFFAGQGPANKDPLRIPSGIEAIPVKSGQQETSVGFFEPARKKNPTLVSIEVEPGCQETGVGFFSQARQISSNKC